MVRFSPRNVTLFVSDGTADVVGHLCKYCNLIYGVCVGVGEVAKGEQLIANTTPIHKSGWVLAPRARKLVLQVSKKSG